MASVGEPVNHRRRKFRRAFGNLNRTTVHRPEQRSYSPRSRHNRKSGSKCLKHFVLDTRRGQHRAQGDIGAPENVLDVMNIGEDTDTSLGGVPSPQ